MPPRPNSESRLEYPDMKDVSDEGESPVYACRASNAPRLRGGAGSPGPSSPNRQRRQGSANSPPSEELSIAGASDEIELFDVDERTARSRRTGSGTLTDTGSEGELSGLDADPEPEPTTTRTASPSGVRPPAQERPANAPPKKYTARPTTLSKAELKAARVDMRRRLVKVRGPDDPVPAGRIKWWFDKHIPHPFPISDQRQYKVQGSRSLEHRLTIRYDMMTTRHEMEEHIANWVVFEKHGGPVPKGPIKMRSWDDRLVYANLEKGPYSCCCSVM